MRSRLSLASSLVFLLGLTQAVAVHAAPLVASSTASITGLSYRLVDLDLTDGITPWIQFNPGNTANLYAVTNPYIEYISFSEGDAGTLGNYSASLSSSDGAITALIAPETQLASVQVDSALMASNAVIDDTYDFKFSRTEFNYWTGSSYWTGNWDYDTGERRGFTLSANTAVVFEGNYAFETSLDVGALKASIYSDAEGWGEVYIRSETDSLLQVQIFSDDHPEKWVKFEDSDTQINWLSSGNTDALFSASKTGDFSLRFENLSSTNVIANFSAGLEMELQGSATAYSPFPSTPAIPEPSTSALMLLGLGVLSAAARRHKAHV